MIKRNICWALFAFIALALMLTAASSFVTPSLAAKKSSNSSSTTHKTTSTPHHIKGVKVFHVHTVPSKVYVGNTFGLRGIVFNNSTATITFANGTCSSPLSITYNNNVITEPQVAAGPCKPQMVTLKPGQQSPILSPNLSGTTFKASAPGVTNATLTFKYGAVDTASKTHFNDSITRVYSFIIKPPSTQHTSTAPTSTAKPVIGSSTKSHV
jgi:hypothetical protein